MATRICHHILENGKLCQSPPMRGRNYCHAHYDATARRMRMAWARARVALRLAEARQAARGTEFSKRNSKAAPQPALSLME
jgi:hypothetical protein